MVLTLTVVVAATIVGATEVGADPPPGAALTPSATHGEPGDTVTVGVTGCAAEDGAPYRYALVRLMTTGADPAVVAFAQSFVGYDGELTLPDWYEPGPARLVADCFQVDGAEGGTPVLVFSFPSVDFELMAGDGPSRQTMTLGRTSVEEGQVIPVELTGCDPGGEYDNAFAVVYEGEGIAGPGWAYGTPVATGFGEPGADGTARIELAVSGQGDAIEPGSYFVLGLCERSMTRFVYPTQAITITGTNPAVGTLTADYRSSAGKVDIAGEGCTGGALVAVRVTSDPGFDAEAAGPDTDARLARVAASGRSTRAIADIVVVPEPDGSWSHVWDLPPEGAQFAQVSADCGDPLADGFRYRPRFVSLGGGLWVSRVSPTSSPAGGPVVVQVIGECDGTVTVELVDDGGEVHATGTTTISGRYGSAELTAPPHADRYSVAVRCGMGRGYGADLEVFDPGPFRSPDPVPPAPPATGWPSAGPVEHFTGRIGPIALPPEHDMGGMDASALPPSGIGIDLPRPEGELAIRSIRYDLVDAGTGQPVPTDDAHLHHFVMGNTAEQNPACPRGTFGLPGEIIGAVGQERSQVDLPDPYGLVVEADDQWSGVYDIMNLGHEAREVYLTYELTFQRDVSRIRPVQTYFFSATGCDSFQWTIDGSGTEDVQSHHVTMEDDGLLVGGGGHVHSGGEASELYDDRGRLLCRAELHVGEGGGHGGPGMSAGRVAATTTTVVDEGPMYPPEFYPDDPPIEHISSCPSINQPVQAGERLRFDAIYTNERARSGVMGIGLFFVWEGGGPADPPAVVPPGNPPPGNPPPGVDPPANPPGTLPPATGAEPLPGKARFTG
jgi:hypothetical protein